MTLYTVHAPPMKAIGASPDPAAIVFVKEGFCWPALFIPELWLIFRRLWIVLVLYVAVVVGMAFASEVIEEPLPAIALILLRLYFALEANGLRRWTLERRSYSLLGVVEGRNLEEAERRFFEEWSAHPAGSGPPGTTEIAAPAAPIPPVPPQPWKPSAEAGELVGLFPAPGGRT